MSLLLLSGCLALRCRHYFCLPLPFGGLVFLFESGLLKCAFLGFLLALLLRRSGSVSWIWNFICLDRNVLRNRVRSHDLTCGALGAIGRFTSGRFVAVMAGSDGGGGAGAGVGTGAGGGIDTTAASLRGTAGGGGCNGVAALATGGWTRELGKADGMSLCAGSGAGDAGTGADCSGAREICKSLASTRRSFQGKCKPGRPKVCPPKARLKSSA
ncbi:hypothetical protein LP420_22320 [Massilia sp. B-10]|nr:hypothetical protein LP420_22320 [Massilia sp. B-10]